MGGRNRKSLRSFVSSSSRAVQERERSEFRVLQAQVGLVPLVKDFNVEIAPDFAQRAWMLKYPSAITSFGHIAAQAKDKKIAVFLDYDGTLVDV